MSLHISPIVTKVNPLEAAESIQQYSPTTNRKIVQECFGLLFVFGWMPCSHPVRQVWRIKKRPTGHARFVPASVCSLATRRSRLDIVFILGERVSPPVPRQFRVRRSTRRPAKTKIRLGRLDRMSSPLQTEKIPRRPRLCQSAVRWRRLVRARAVRTFDSVSASALHCCTPLWR